MKCITFGIIAFLLFACAPKPKPQPFRPVGAISRIDSTTYMVEYTGSSEDHVRKVMSNDGNGICKEETGKHYYIKVDEKIEFTGVQMENKETGIGGALKALGNRALESKQFSDWKGFLKFSCK